MVKNKAYEFCIKNIDLETTPKYVKLQMRDFIDLCEGKNEKYLARAFLLRLGYVGNDSKAERHLLLDHLSGSSAFPTEEAARKHSEKYAAIRAEQRLAKTEAAIREVMSDE